jgi:hypothetical protein
VCGCGIRDPPYGVQGCFIPDDPANPGAGGRCGAGCHITDPVSGIEVCVLDGTRRNESHAVGNSTDGGYSGGGDAPFFFSFFPFFFFFLFFLSRLKQIFF